MAQGCLWLLATLSLLHGQTDSAAAPPPPAEARENAAPEGAKLLKMRGTVAFVSQMGRYFMMIRERAAQGFRVAPAQPLPSFGTEVEIEYDPASFSSGGWDARSIRSLGPGKFPEPVQCTPDDVMVGKFDTKWVEVDAVVLQVKYAMGFLWVQLAGRGGWGMANIYQWPAGPLKEDWWGARVKIRGLNIGHGQNAFRVNDPSLLTIVKPGVANPFSIPESDIVQVASAAESSADRVKIKATVLGSLGTIVYLRSGTTAFQADILYPFDTQQDPSGQFLKAPKLPYLDRGDEVEMIGSPLRLHAFTRLNYAQFKVLKRGGTAVPRAVTLEDAALGRAGNDLVILRGRLLAHHETSSGKMRRETLELTDGRREINAVLDSATGGRLTKLSVDDLVEVTGLVEPASGSPPWMIRLSSVKEATSLGLAPEVMWRRLLEVLATIGLALVLGGGLLWWVRRRSSRSREREAAIRDEHAALERRVAERTRELESAKEELGRALFQERELSELKSRFVTIVSHEFRTPLGIIMSAVELLRHYHDRLPAEQRQELCEDIFTSTRHMGGLMEQVLLLGRVEAGKLGCRPAPLDLQMLAAKLIDETLSATNRRCPIHWKPEGDIRGAVGDEALLRHVFSNLISNAVKYSPEGGEVEWRCRREGDAAIFTVTDRGIGIRKEDLPRLFEAFQRGGNVGEIPGTGLGLVIVKRCAELHGGSVTIAPRTGGGTAFTVRVPMFAATPAASPEATELSPV